MRRLDLDVHLVELRRRVCSTSVLQAPGLGCGGENELSRTAGASAAVSSLDGYALDPACLFGQ